jgi:hypothetical protein
MVSSTCEAIGDGEISEEEGQTMRHNCCRPLVKSTAESISARDSQRHRPSCLRDETYFARGYEHGHDLDDWL